MVFVKSNCVLPTGPFHRQPGTLTALPPHSTTQVAQSALRWQSRSIRSSVTNAGHGLLALDRSAIRPQCGRLAHHAPSQLIGRLRSLSRPSSRNAAGSLITLCRCSQAACACSTCVQAAGSVAVAAGLAIKATFA